MGKLSNPNASDYSRMCVVAGLKVWKQNKDVLLGQQALELGQGFAMMRAACFGGMAIAQTGTSLPHGLSYSLTVHQGLAHGLACGYFLAGYLLQAEAKERDLLIASSWFHFFRAVARFL